MLDASDSFVLHLLFYTFSSSFFFFGRSICLLPDHLSSNTYNKLKHTHSCNFLRCYLFGFSFKRDLSAFQVGFVALYVHRSDRQLANFISRLWIIL